MTLPLQLRRARLLATKLWPYYSTALWRVDFREDPNPGLEPVAIDKRWRVSYSPEWLDKLTLKQLAFCLVHEINHCLRNHHGRVGDRDPLIWNLATDMEINDDFSSDAIEPTKEFTPVFPVTFGFHPHLLAEKYYDLLKKTAKKITIKIDCGPGCHGQGDKSEGEKGEPQGESEALGVSELEAELIRSQVANAIKNGLQAGHGSAGAPLWVDEFLTPKVNWRKLLARYVSKAGAVVSGCTDYSYSRPARRSWAPFIMPRMISRQVKIGIVMDTSGSMSKSLLSRALAEIKGIAKSGNMDSKVFFTEDEVSAVGKAGDKGLAAKMRGGGGTDMRVGIATALKERPNLIEVITDGYTPWPTEDEVPVPLIACLVTGEKVPKWMKVVRVED